MEQKRIGFVTIPKKVLKIALKLPPDADIREIKWKWEDDTLMVKFSSEKCPELNDGLYDIPRVNHLMDWDCD